MSYNYTQFVTTLSTMLVVPSTDPNFLAVLPNIIDDGEQRCYRELDLLSTVVRDSSAALTANSRSFTLPNDLGQFVVTNGFNVYTPVGTTTTRNQLVPTTRDYLDAVWGNEASASTPSIPNRYAMITDQQIIVGPPPDAAYTIEVIGTIRPTPLSATNATTVLTLYLPDLFLSACLVFSSGYLKNYGAASDDPKMAMSWEAHYQEELKSANVEEIRKKYAAQGWSSMQPSPVTTPPRV
jgi:hypothetical protein